jgi:RNA polymerase sigma factor (sigma-70 family)
MKPLSITRSGLRHRRIREERKRNAVITAHLGLVVSIAERIHSRLPPCFDIGDLIGEGNAALVKAAEAYDPNGWNQTPFSAFARHRIRGAIIESVRRNRYVEQTRDSIDDFGSRTFHGDYDDVTRYGSETERGLFRVAHRPTCEAHVDRKRLNARVSLAISRLPAAERNLLRIWYGNDEPKPNQVARRLGVSAGQAETLHSSAIARLQMELNPGSPRERAELPRAA